MSEVRILIADDSPAVRAGLKLLLELHPEWKVCGEAEDGREAVKKAAELQPDVILIDTHFESLDLARYAAQTGVRGYITKSRIPTDLEKAIKAAAQHHSP